MSSIRRLSSYYLWNLLSFEHNEGDNSPLLWDTYVLITSYKVGVGFRTLLPVCSQQQRQLIRLSASIELFHQTIEI